MTASRQFGNAHADILALIMSRSATHTSPFCRLLVSGNAGKGCNKYLGYESLLAVQVVQETFVFRLFHLRAPLDVARYGCVIVERVVWSIMDRVNRHRFVSAHSIRNARRAFSLQVHSRRQFLSMLIYPESWFLETSD